MEKLNNLENILHVLDKKPNYKLSINIDDMEVLEQGDDIYKIIENLVNIFLKKYQNIINLSISPINALQEICVKKNLSTPIYEFSVIDNKFYVICKVNEYITKSEHVKKKQAKKQVSLDMLKLLIKNF